MFNSPFFDTVIAMITLYLIFSQLTLSLVELPAGFLNTRGRYLHRHLAKVLGTTGRDAFYANPAIQALISPRNEQSLVTRLVSVPRWPAYISETLFAQTIIAWVNSLAPPPPALVPPPVPAPAPPTAIGQFNAGLGVLTAPGGALGPVPATGLLPDFAGILSTLYANALTAATPAEQSQALQTSLAGWFHEYGERMSGWYKRDNRKYLFLGGLLVALLADVDTVRLARFISDSNNIKARAALVEAGVHATQQARPRDLAYVPTDSQYHQKQVRHVDSLLVKGVTDFQQTLSSIPAVGLPLGTLRWTQHQLDTIFQPLPAPVPGRKHGPIVGYKWAPTADDYAMPVYAQRNQLDEKTGAYTPLGSPILGLPVTWEMLGSWLLTAFAMMLGAPFWFDTLCRFVNIRNVGIKPPKAPTTS